MHSKQNTLQTPEKYSFQARPTLPCTNLIKIFPAFFLVHMRTQNIIKILCERKKNDFFTFCFIGLRLVGQLFIYFYEMHSNDFYITLRLDRTHFNSLAQISDWWYSNSWQTHLKHRRFWTLKQVCATFELSTGSSFND